MPVAMDPSALDQALAACASEPIHTPGSIQSAGILLAVDRSILRVTHASQNAEPLLGRPLERVWGEDVDALLPKTLVHAMRSIAGVTSLGRRRERIGSFSIAGTPFDAAVFLNEEALVLELEPSRAKFELFEALAASRRLKARYLEEPKLNRLLEATVRSIRELTGYDRVMAYRFLEGGDGEVVAEAARPGLTPFLGLRYPASDIPPQARALYLRNPVRFIADVASAPVPLRAERADAPPLDLSLGELRGVSPVHLTYLHNMGVASSLSLAIQVEDELWGLIACHHHEPRQPSADTRSAATALAMTAGLLVQVELERNAREDRATGERTLVALAAKLSASQAPVIDDDFARLLVGLVPADGLCIRNGPGSPFQWGKMPSEEVTASVQQWAAQKGDDVVTVDRLAETLGLEASALGTIAGVLVVKPAPVMHPMELHFYREEVVQTLTWGGPPDKTIVNSAEGPRLSPRTSFDQYRTKVTGSCTPWTARDVERAQGLAYGLLRLIARQAQSHHERQMLIEHTSARQEILVAELSHRVKNVLALVRSVARRSRDASPTSVETFVLGLEQRLQALAVAHDLSANTGTNAVDLETLLLKASSPYRGTAEIDVRGPEVSLPASVAPSFALVFHELVSNAEKHGALSTPTGRVVVRWSVDAAGLRFEYREVGGPMVTQPTRRGFGIPLLERAIPYELGGRTQLTFAPEGVRFEAFLPAQALRRAQPGPSPQTVVSSIDVAHLPLRVLVIEDNLLLASDIEEALRRRGCREVSCAGTVAGALFELSRGEYDAAVLDLDLHGETSFSIADRLAAQRIPFVFLSGYGSEVAVPAAHAHVERLAKPFEEAALMSGLQKLASSLVSPLP